MESRYFKQLKLLQKFSYLEKATIILHIHILDFVVIPMEFDVKVLNNFGIIVKCEDLLSDIQWYANSLVIKQNVQ